ncbi:helix-turn-helix domain-containing protein [Belliella baltica]|uniref:helix-turn-helix domain-containing protein n=1 Tax=Belliella baltica TaxID=232259 RepID=UPI00030A8748|nr:helix-turn-helix domain-containing protein [Belliella baltica]
MTSIINRIQGQEMLRFLEENDTYKKTNLDLYTFSKIIGVSPRTLSGLVQEAFDLGFRGFLNQFRIHKAQELMSKHKANWLVQDYALAVGYSSRITFFKAFKTQTGMSPEEYIKRL